jgi:hypothetical protein
MGHVRLGLPALGGSFPKTRKFLDDAFAGLDPSLRRKVDQLARPHRLAVPARARARHGRREPVEGRSSICRTARSTSGGSRAFTSSE